MTLSGSYWLGTEWGQTQLWHRSPGGRDRGFSVTLRGRLQPQLYKRLETLQWVGLTPGLSSDGKAIICGGHSFYKHTQGVSRGTSLPSFCPCPPSCSCSGCGEAGFAVTEGPRAGLEGGSAFLQEPALLRVCPALLREWTHHVSHTRVYVHVINKM